MQQQHGDLQKAVCTDAPLLLCQVTTVRWAMRLPSSSSQPFPNQRHKDNQRHLLAGNTTSHLRLSLSCSCSCLRLFNCVPCCALPALLHMPCLPLTRFGCTLHMCLETNRMNASIVLVCHTQQAMAVSTAEAGLAHMLCIRHQDASANHSGSSGSRPVLLMVIVRLWR